MSEQFVGRTANQERLFLNIRLDYHESANKQSIDHGPLATPSYLRLSIMGAVVEPRARDMSRGGQCIEAFEQPITPASGWDQTDINSAVQLWHRWHLNDMQAWCAHMSLPDDRSYDARRHIVCARTDYRYGQSWLVEVLPDDVVEEVRRIMALPRGNVPAWFR